jgi:predicted transcriptional regulator
MRNATDGNIVDLGALEQQVLDLLWQCEPCHSEAIREKLSRPLKNSTIRTVLRRLMEKGLVRHKSEGRTYIYRTAVSRDRFTANAVKQVLDQFCDGSLEALLQALVEHAVVDRQELKRLAKRLAKSKSE